MTWLLAATMATAGDWTYQAKGPHGYDWAVNSTNSQGLIPPVSRTFRWIWGRDSTGKLDLLASQQDESALDVLDSDSVSSGAYWQYINCLPYQSAMAGVDAAGEVWEAVDSIGSTPSLSTVGPYHHDVTYPADATDVDTLQEYCDYIGSFDSQSPARRGASEVSLMQVRPNTIRAFIETDGSIRGNNLAAFFAGNHAPAVTPIDQSHDISTSGYDGPHVAGWDVFVDPTSTAAWSDLSVEDPQSTYHSGTSIQLRAVIQHELMHVIGAGHISLDSISASRGSSTMMVPKDTGGSRGSGAESLYGLAAPFFDPPHWQSEMTSRLTLLAADKAFIAEHYGYSVPLDVALFNTELEIVAGSGKPRFRSIYGAPLGFDPDLHAPTLTGCAGPQGLIPKPPWTYEDIEAALPRVEGFGTNEYDSDLHIEFEFLGVAEWDNFIAVDDALTFADSIAVNQRAAVHAPETGGIKWVVQPAPPGTSGGDVDQPEGPVLWLNMRVSHAWESHDLDNNAITTRIRWERDSSCGL